MWLESTVPKQMGSALALLSNNVAQQAKISLMEPAIRSFETQHKAWHSISQRLLTLALCISFAIGCRKSSQNEETPKDKAPSSLIDQSTPHTNVQLKSYTLEKGSTLASSLRNSGIPSNEIPQVLAAVSKKMNLRTLPAGLKYSIKKTHSEILEISIKQGPLKYLKVTRGDQWTTSWETKQPSKELRSFKGQVTSTLWESAMESGLPPQLIIKMADIFAWQIDFSREIRKGDRWSLVALELTHNGDHVQWGKILVAEYINKKEQYQAIAYTPSTGNPGYYFPDGNSLKRLFLKSPIKFGRITSHFTKKRFHPILKINKPHNGVDYGAPVGTPIRVVGDGQVIFKGWKGASGRFVKVRHNSTYTTSYSHLSGYAKGLKTGKKVTQGQTIGYVGSSGLATGPHLHFAFYERGRFVNPLGKKFPSADPIAKDELLKFQQHAMSQLRLLPYSKTRLTESPQEPISKDIWQSIEWKL